MFSHFTIECMTFGSIEPRLGLNKKYKLYKWSKMVSLGVKITPIYYVSSQDTGTCKIIKWVTNESFLTVSSKMSFVTSVNLLGIGTSHGTETYWFHDHVFSAETGVNNNWFPLCAVYLVWLNYRAIE